MLGTISGGRGSQGGRNSGRIEVANKKNINHTHVLFELWKNLYWPQVLTTKNTL